MGQYYYSYRCIVEPKRQHPIQPPSVYPVMQLGDPIIRNESKAIRRLLVMGVARDDIRFVKVKPTLTLSGRRRTGIRDFDLRWRIRSLNVDEILMWLYDVPLESQFFGDNRKERVKFIKARSNRIIRHVLRIESVPALEGVDTWRLWGFHTGRRCHPPDITDPDPYDALEAERSPQAARNGQWLWEQLSEMVNHKRVVPSYQPSLRRQSRRASAFFKTKQGGFNAEVDLLSRLNLKASYDGLLFEDLQYEQKAGGEWDIRYHRAKDQEKFNRAVNSSIYLIKHRERLPIARYSFAKEGTLKIRDFHIPEATDQIVCTLLEEIGKRVISSSFKSFRWGVSELGQFKEYYSGDFIKSTSHIPPWFTIGVADFLVEKSGMPAPLRRDLKECARKIFGSRNYYKVKHDSRFPYLLDRLKRDEFWREHHHLVPDMRTRWGQTHILSKPNEPISKLGNWEVEVSSTPNGELTSRWKRSRSGFEPPFGSTRGYGGDAWQWTETDMREIINEYLRPQIPGELICTGTNGILMSLLFAHIVLAFANSIPHWGLKHLRAPKAFQIKGDDNASGHPDRESIERLKAICEKTGMKAHTEEYAHVSSHGYHLTEKLYLRRNPDGRPVKIPSITTRILFEYDRKDYAPLQVPLVVAEEFHKAPDREVLIRAMSYVYYQYKNIYDELRQKGVEVCGEYGLFPMFEPQSPGRRQRELWKVPSEFDSLSSYSRELEVIYSRRRDVLATCAHARDARQIPWRTEWLTVGQVSELLSSVQIRSVFDVGPSQGVPGKDGGFSVELKPPKARNPVIDAVLRNLDEVDREGKIFSRSSEIYWNYDIGEDDPLEAESAKRRNTSSIRSLRESPQYDRNELILTDIRCWMNGTSQWIAEPYGFEALEKRPGIEWQIIDTVNPGEPVFAEDVDPGRVESLKDIPFIFMDGGLYFDQPTVVHHQGHIRPDLLCFYNVLRREGPKCSLFKDADPRNESRECYFYCFGDSILHTIHHRAYVQEIDRFLHTVVFPLAGHKTADDRMMSHYRMIRENENTRYSPIHIFSNDQEIYDRAEKMEAEFSLGTRKVWRNRTSRGKRGGPCKFYQQGNCRKGKHCQFDHSSKECAYGKRCRKSECKFQHPPDRRSTRRPTSRVQHESWTPQQVTPMAGWGETPQGGPILWEEEVKEEGEIPDSDDPILDYGF